MVTIVKLGIAANQHQNSLLFEDLALKKKSGKSSGKGFMQEGSFEMLLS